MRSRCHAVVPCRTKASAVVVVDASGSGKVVAGWASGLLGVPAAAEQPDHAPPVAVAADELGARDQRELLRGEVGVRGLVGVGVVDAGRGHVEQQLAAVGHRLGEVDELEDLRAAELRHLDRSHRADPNAAAPGAPSGR